MFKAEQLELELLRVILVWLVHLRRPQLCIIINSRGQAMALGGLYS